MCVGHNIQNVKLAIVNDEMKNCSSDVYEEKCFLNDYENMKLSCMFIDNLREHDNLLVNNDRNCENRKDF